MVRRRWIGAVGSLVVGLVLVAVPTPVVASGPDAGLGIERQAFEGPRGTIFAAVRARCAPGLVVSELAVDFTQGDVVTPITSVQPFPCDGRWRRLDVSSAEAFEPGRARMTVRLSLLDADTGDPAGQLVRSRPIDVRAAGAIVLPARARLVGGDLVVRLRARCDEPWLAEDFLVSAFQPATNATAFAHLSTPCDGRWRRLTARLVSVSTPFERGPADLHADISLFDPEFFDPVAQPRADRTVVVR